MTFKVGDRVECINGSSFFYVGDLGTVKQVSDDMCDIEWDVARRPHHEGKRWWASFEKLKNVQPLEEFVSAPDSGALLRKFDSGATRDLDTSKLDYEAFLAPSVLEAYAEYMHSNRLQADGSLRDGDNWQKGIPRNVYMKSMFRHFFDVWKEHRGLSTPDGLKKNLMALLFNVMGYAFELLKEKENV